MNSGLIKSRPWLVMTGSKKLWRPLRAGGKVSSLQEHGENLGGWGSTNLCCVCFTVPSTGRCQRPKPSTILHWCSLLMHITPPASCSSRRVQQSFHLQCSFPNLSAGLIKLLSSVELGRHCLEGLSIPQLEQSPSTKMGGGLVANTDLQTDS